MHPSKSINTRAIPNQTPTPTKREDCYTVRAWPSPLSNPRGSKTDDRPVFWSALLITSFIAECLGKRPALYLQDKPCKPLLSILPPQRQDWGIQTSAPTLRAMATLKLSWSSSVPSDETGKTLSQAPLSFRAVASNLVLDTWSSSSSILSQLFLAIGRSQAFWSLGSSGKEAPPLAPLQDSTASASSLVSTMLILERIVSTNSPTEFIEAIKEGRAISPALLHPRPPKLTGHPACLYTSSFNDTLATLSTESKRALSKTLNSSPHKRRCSQYILQLWYRKGILQQKQMLDVGSALPTLMSFSQALPFSPALFMECLECPPGLLGVKGHTLQLP